jgi:hypothetical protein
MSPTLLLFQGLVVAHIMTGGFGALILWIPVLGRKGGVNHRLWGTRFCYALLATGCFAVGMSLLTLIDPLGTHPHLIDRFDVVFIRAIFGWMMLHNGILTINLAWHGWRAIRTRSRETRDASTFNHGLQWVLMAAAIQCAWQGWLTDQKLMLGMAIVGLATAITNLLFLFKPKLERRHWLKEHVKALVGAGISAYTAFMAFGAVRLMPEMALNPVMWSIPLAVGITIIVFHWAKIELQARNISLRFKPDRAQRRPVEGS